MKCKTAARWLASLLLGFLIANPLSAQEYTISTIAGGIPVPTPAGALDASISAGYLTAGIDGSLYFVSGYAIYAVANGVMTRFAGTARRGSSADGALASNSPLNPMTCLTADTAGNVYFCEASTIRRISPRGIITTVAGVGDGGYSQDGGLAIKSALQSPRGLTVDAAGNLYFAETSRIRRVGTDGILSTVAGIAAPPGFSGDGGPAKAAQLLAPQSVAVDAVGNIYIADTQNGRVRRVTADGVINTIAGNGTHGYSGDGGPAVSAALAFPSGLALDRGGNLFIADRDNHRIRRVTPAGIITTVAGTGVPGFSGDGGAAINAQLRSPASVTIDASGNLYVPGSGRIRRISPDGTIATMAGNGAYSHSGDGGPASAAQLGSVTGLALDASGNLLVSDSDNSVIRRIAPDGTISRFAGTGVAGFAGDGGPALDAQFSGPTALALDASGNLYVADSSGGRVRRITPAGIVSTVAGNGTWGFSGDGGPAVSAQLYAPRGVAVDAAGSLYIADSMGNRIRRVTAAGIISTIAGTGFPGYLGDGGPAISAQLNNPQGLSTDSAGNLYIADSGNPRVRKVAPDGLISSVAGGLGPIDDLAKNAFLPGANATALDAAGNLYIAASTRVLRVNPAGLLYTVADSYDGSSGDDGPAIGTYFWQAVALALDPGGKIYVADITNNAIRVLTPTSTPCTVTRSPRSMTIPAAGGTFLLSVEAPPGCPWTIFKRAEWLSLSPVSGSGPAVITLTAGGNGSSKIRSDTMLLAGLETPITQTPAEPNEEVTVITQIWPTPGGAALPASVTLRWTASPEVPGPFRLYFGATNPPPLRNVGDAQQLHLAGLTPGMTYYWRVERAVPSRPVSTSVVSSFTVSALPVPRP